MRMWRWLSAVVLVVAGVAVAGVVDRPPPAAADVRPAAGQYVPVTPARIENGRTVPAKGDVEFSPLGRGGVPATGVSAVRFTMSTYSADGSGWMVAHPFGTERPLASHLNFIPKVWDTNSVVMAPGTGGQITVYNDSTRSALLYVDVVGYYRAAGATVAGETFVPLQPARIFTGPVEAGQTALVEPLGKGGIPAANVSTVLAHVTIDPTDAVAGNVTVYPDGTTRPGTSDISFTGPSPYTNQVPARLGSNGKFRVYSGGKGTVTVDIVGYYQPPSGTAAGSSFVPLTPVRVVGGTIIEPNGTVPVTLAGKGGVPTTGVAAVAFNLTADDQDANTGALSVWAADQPTPVARQLSYKAGVHAPTLQVSRLGADGTVTVRNVSSGRVRILLDVAGWYRAATAPPAPTGVTAQGGDAQTVVRWTPPAGDGGASITGYRVTASPGGTTLDVTGVTSAVFANLTNGTPYTFTVAARNAAGLGTPSGATAAVTPLAATAPGAPTAVTARARHTSAVVSWQRPADDGRLAIQRYTVTASPGGATATVTAPGTEVQVPGLTDGTAYTFRVTATNARGTGAASAASAPVVPAPSVPDAPSDVVAAATATGTVGVEWVAPAYDGGGAVTGYTVTVQPGGRTVTVPATVTKTDVTGLTAGTEYTFAVTATSARGPSPAATTAPVTPDLVFRPGTRELSAAALATLASVGTHEVRFTNAPAEVTGVPVGAILVGAEPPAPHEPFLVRVESVQTSGTTTTLQVRPATISQAFTDTAFAAMADLGGDAEVAAAFAATGTVSQSFSVEAQPGIRLTGTYTSTMKPDVEFSLKGRKRITIRTTDRIEVALTADRKATELDLTPLLLERQLLPDKLRKKHRVYPGIRLQLRGVVTGHLHAGYEVYAASVLEGTMVIDLGDPARSTVHFDEKYESPTVGAIANAGLTFGVRVGLAATTYNIKRAEVRYTHALETTINVRGDPWWKIQACTYVDVETEPWFIPAINWIPLNFRPYSDCDPVDEAPGPLPLLRITPDDVMLPPGGSVTFRAASDYGLGTPTWSVNGTGNGSVDQNGKYTAPNKNGVFAVIATIAASGGRQGMRGTAYVRVGAPPTPTLFVTALPATPSGITRVGVTLLANGPSPFIWRIRVEPENPSSPCWANAWVVLGLFDSDTLFDVSAEDRSIRCDLLRVGQSYRFYLTAIGPYGNSDEVTAPPVTILGPGNGPVAAASGGRGVGPPG